MKKIHQQGRKTHYISPLNIIFTTDFFSHRVPDGTDVAEHRPKIHSANFLLKLLSGYDAVGVL
jgi:hypothetical protein